MAVILDKLYQAFPLRIPLRDNSFDDEADGSVVDGATLLIYRDTIRFLNDEGFLRYESWSAGSTIYFESVSLTAKGLAVLNTVPDVLKEKTTLGEKLRNSLRSGSSEALKTLVNQIISVAVTYGAGQLQS